LKDEIKDKRHFFFVFVIDRDKKHLSFDSPLFPLSEPFNMSESTIAIIITNGKFLAAQ